MTEELGRWMAENGHTLVFGGCNLGLMECVAKAVHDAGGTTIGVVPMIIEKGGKVSDYVDVKMMCDNLSDRKDFMLAQCDVAVALPGGVGTLEHFAEGIIEGEADAVLAASVFHFGTYSIRQVKEYIASQGIPVRLDF